jgi:hypothetical protein
MGSKLTIWAAGAALALAGSSAYANFTFSSTRTAGTGAQAGFDIVRFFAKLDPTGNTAGATGLQSVDAEIITSGNLKFRFQDQNADGIADADPTGTATQNDNAARLGNTNNGSFIRAGDPTAGAFNAVSVLPPGALSKDSDFDGTPDPGFDPAVNYGSLKSFRVAGFTAGGADAKAISDPAGSLFAMAVVPTGSAVQIVGFVAADKGNAEAIPEPTALGFIGIAGAALLGRRRKQA